MIHTVKGFSVVNEAEVDVFLDVLCFLHDPKNVSNLISGFSAFAKPSLYVWKFLVHIWWKPSVKDFKHNLPSMWNDTVARYLEHSLALPFFGKLENSYREDKQLRNIVYRDIYTITIWKRSVFIPIPKKHNAKECSNYWTIALISHASKVMLKILQVKLQQYVNKELPDVQDGFRKGRGTRDQIAKICWIIEKPRDFQKNIYFCFIDYAKAIDSVDHNKLLKNSQRDESTRPPYLSPEKPVCGSRRNS